MNNQLVELLIDEIRENRKAITDLTERVHAMDKSIFSNKLKLSVFLGGFSLFFSIVWAIIIEKIKNTL